MEETTNWSHPARQSSDIAGSLLLASSGLLLLGVWSALWMAHARFAESGLRLLRWHPVALEEYREACDRGDSTACNDLGVSYERGYGTRPDADVARELFERACGAGLAEACNNQAALLEHGRDSDADMDSALRLYRRACEGGSALGCSNLGALYAMGKGVGRDRAEARWLFERACQAGGALGCQNLVALDEASLRRELQAQSDQVDRARPEAGRDQNSSKGPFAP
jgi:TPR repeat protein